METNLNMQFDSGGKYLKRMARLEGLEPPTLRFEV